MGKEKVEQEYERAIKEGSKYAVVDIGTGEIVQYAKGGSTVRVKSGVNDGKVEMKKVNSSKLFIKVIEENEKKAMEMLRGNSSAYYALGVLKQHLSTVENSVVRKDGDAYTCGDLGKDMGCSRQYASRMIRVLEAKGLVRRNVSENREFRYIYVNPYVYCKANVVAKYVADMFLDVEWVKR